MNDQERIDTWLAANLPGRGAVAAELRAELAAHLETALSRARDSGASEENAFHQATRELGDVRAMRRVLLLRRLRDLLQLRFLCCVLGLGLVGFVFSIFNEFERMINITKGDSYAFMMWFAYFALPLYAIWAGFRPLKLKRSIAAAALTIVIGYAMGLFMDLLIWFGVPLPFNSFVAVLAKAEILSMLKWACIGWVAIWLILFLIPWLITRAIVRSTRWAISRARRTSAA